MPKTTKRPEIRAAVDGAIHDGKGGTFKKGDILPEMNAETLESLKSKGFV